MCLIFYDCWGWCTMYNVPCTSSAITHTLCLTGLWANLCHSIISLLVIRDVPLDLACPHVRPAPFLANFSSSFSRGSCVCLCLCWYILLLSISMINKCRPQHYWHLNHNNSASLGQNMLRLYKLHSTLTCPHLKRLTKTTHTHTT